MEIETETHIGTLNLTPEVQMRSRRRENVSKEGRIRGSLHQMMNGDLDRDPHWNTGLNSLGPKEKKKEGEHEQESQDLEECVHPLIQGD